MKFIDFILILFFILFIIWSTERFFNLPVVYWSVSKNRCVKVIYDGIETDCNTLPEKYERVWVK